MIFMITFNVEKFSILWIQFNIKEKKKKNNAPRKSMQFTYKAHRLILLVPLYHDAQPKYRQKMAVTTR